MFTILSPTNQIVQVGFILSSANALGLVKAKSIVIWSTFNDSEKEVIENIVGKGENAGNQHFLLSPNVFFYSQNKVYDLSQIYFVVCSLSI